jgi:uncharacterized protein (DUF924 family)
MYQDIIKFWFEEIDQSMWFKKDIHFDNLIRSRFSDIHSKAVKCELFAWRNSQLNPELGCLAEIIILDQFSRNMYRDKPESFAYDSLALALAQSAIAAGHDLTLIPELRSFIYMPFMHSESVEIHQEAVNLFTQLGNTDTLRFEKRHQAIIEKFGRYPDRNAILGRESSREEIEFLTLPGSRF